jgi:antitoxin component HigA of HigAB toxin-antitoxin module
MEDEVLRFQRVVISFEKSADFPELPPSKRSLKPIQVFSELQAIVENFYPGFSTVLVKPGTSEIIGSQDELLFAYQDITDGKVLPLELNLFKPSKRKHVSEKYIAAPEFRHEGPWSNGEIELFKMGVDQFGWRKWKSIAGVIGSRDREQVRQFSSTPKGI